MKRVFPIILFLLSVSIISFSQEENYTPSIENVKAREAFANSKFGLFIHWGVFSIPGSGEWVMNDRRITIKNYSRLIKFFNPIDFNADSIVRMAKNAGMKYITLVTRHHDGFSLWDTKYSDFNVMNSPYKKDVVRMMADVCHQQGIKLFLYYSLLDWRRDDYPYKSGRTGQSSGRISDGNYYSYLQFMKNQLTELLTNYGEVGGIWFDGHWDQTAPEGEKDRSSKIDWKYEEIYSLIHRLQPACLIGNNHHLTPFAGEDFQMFEHDLPGENKSGLSFQQVAQQFPLETCETINGSWGFSLTDTSYKSTSQLINYLVKASGHGANLLLNIGPMPNGEVQPEFKDRLAAVGSWLNTYGESIYNTTAGYLKAQDWGVITQKENKMYIHLLKQTSSASLKLEDFPAKKITGAYLLKDKSKVKATLKNKVLTITLPALPGDTIDGVIVLEISN